MYGQDKRFVAASRRENERRITNDGRIIALSSLSLSLAAISEATQQNPLIAFGLQLEPGCPHAHSLSISREATVKLREHKQQSDHKTRMKK